MSSISRTFSCWIEQRVRSLHQIKVVVLFGFLVVDLPDRFVLDRAVVASSDPAKVVVLFWYFVVDLPDRFVLDGRAVDSVVSGLFLLAVVLVWRFVCFVPPVVKVSVIERVVFFLPELIVVL